MTAANGQWPRMRRGAIPAGLPTGQVMALVKLLNGLDQAQWGRLGLGWASRGTLIARLPALPGAGGSSGWLASISASRASTSGARLLPRLCSDGPKTCAGRPLPGDGRSPMTAIYRVPGDFQVVADIGLRTAQRGAQLGNRHRSLGADVFINPLARSLHRRDYTAFSQIYITVNKR